MLFTWLLVASTMALAITAEFFSVYGLAFTFGGVFWSTVVMGAALGGGKLMAVSYLYRYWTKTHVALKAYLLAGIAALMLLTSGGIFGYLSTGYQQDVLPLKQKNEQVQLLTEERTRALARKKQIDDLLAGGPNVTEVKSDAATVRTLRETTKARESSAKQYRQEQEQVTKRIADLDAQLLALRTDLIKVEAHIGPITYIAKAFNMPTDDATKYLIYLIMFSFDPMAIALTLASNIAFRLRKEEKEAAEKEAQEQPMPDQEFVLDRLPFEFDNEKDTSPFTFPYTEEPVPEPSPPPEVTQPPEPPPTIEHTEPPVQPPVAEQPLKPPRQRAYPGMWSNTPPPAEKVSELINYHKSLTAKVEAGQQLSKDEEWEKRSIEDVLRRHRLDIYL